MLAKEGAQVVAIEGNSNAYLRSLVARELIGYANSQILYGDFMEYLRSHHSSWDLIVASGVLYHLNDPLEFIQLCAERTDRLFLWTHYYEADLALWNQSLLERDAAKWSLGEPYRLSRKGQYATCVKHAYLNALDEDSFCGGLDTTSTWIAREDLLRVLAESGFNTIRTAFEEPSHPNGPCLAIYAQRNS
jgi:hypothetical protein